MIVEPTDANETRFRDLPDSEKPREKALARGIGVLSTKELLAIILGSGIKGKPVDKLSHEILVSINYNLTELPKLSIDYLVNHVKGMGRAKAVSVAASIELGRRYYQALEKRDNERPKVTSSQTAYNFIRDEIECLPHETFWVIHLNRANRIIGKDCVSSGGVSSTLVDPKLIFNSAVNRLSSGLILCHNHPSGTLLPSAQDDMLTRKITEGAKLLEISVLDHLIVSSEGYYSYHDEGKI